MNWSTIPSVRQPGQSLRPFSNWCKVTTFSRSAQIIQQLFSADFQSSVRNCPLPSATVRNCPLRQTHHPHLFNLSLFYWSSLQNCTGLYLCTDIGHVCINIALCSSANCSNKSADDEVLCGVNFPVLCLIVRYCALLCTTLKISWK